MLTGGSPPSLERLILVPNPIHCFEASIDAINFLITSKMIDFETLKTIEPKNTDLVNAVQTKLEEKARRNGVELIVDDLEDPDARRMAFLNQWYLRLAIKSLSTRAEKVVRSPINPVINVEPKLRSWFFLRFSHHTSVLVSVFHTLGYEPCAMILITISKLDSNRYSPCKNVVRHQARCSSEYFSMPCTRPVAASQSLFDIRASSALPSHSATKTRIRSSGVAFPCLTFSMTLLSGRTHNHSTSYFRQGIPSMIYLACKTRTLKPLGKLQKEEPVGESQPHTNPFMSEVPPESGLQDCPGNVFLSFLQNGAMAWITDIAISYASSSLQSTKN